MKQRLCCCSHKAWQRSLYSAALNIFLTNSAKKSPLPGNHLRHLPLNFKSLENPETHTRRTQEFFWSHIFFSIAPNYSSTFTDQLPGQKCLVTLQDSPGVQILISQDKINAGLHLRLQERKYIGVTSSTHSCRILHGVVRCFLTPDSLPSFLQCLQRELFGLHIIKVLTSTTHSHCALIFFPHMCWTATRHLLACLQLAGWSTLKANTVQTEALRVQNYYRPPEVWAPLLCFRIEVSDMRLLVRFRLLGVPQTLFPLLKGELKGEEALEGPKSASPEGRMIAACRGLLADMPSNRKENQILHKHIIPLVVLQQQTMS